MHGETFAREIVPLSAKPFNFQMEYGLTEEQVTDSINLCMTNLTKTVKHAKKPKTQPLFCGCVLRFLNFSSVVSAQALQVSDHYPVEVLLKVIESSVSYSGATSLALTGTRETANQKTSQTKLFSLFVLGHLFFQVFTW